MCLLSSDKYPKICKIFLWYEIILENKSIFKSMGLSMKKRVRKFSDSWGTENIFK